MTISFIGHGYVGLVTACVFADLGNTVYVVGRSEEKLAKLSSGNPLIYEPGLAELLKKNLAAGRIIFTSSYTKAIPSSDVVFIAVGTPPKKNDEADLSNVLLVAENIGKNLGNKYTVVSCKSTVPVGTNRKIKKIIDKIKPSKARFDIASCPEFLREGTALNDTFTPDRIVIGSESQEATNVLLKLHQSLSGERVVVGIESAEIIKYASNSLLATKISFANFISFICDKAHANVEEVLEGVGLDKRIGRSFLYPGVGYGGSCFPKDVKALIKTAEHLNVDTSLLISVEKINSSARNSILSKVLSNTKGKSIGIWGLAFKPNTDDIREAPSLYILEHLLGKKFTLKAFDPAAGENIQKVFGDSIEYVQNPYEAVKGVDCLIVLTEWNDFKQIDLKKVKKLMHAPLIVDGRNIYDPASMKKLGFTYISVGR